MNRNCVRQQDSKWEKHRDQPRGAATEPGEGGQTEQSERKEVRGRETTTEHNAGSARHKAAGGGTRQAPGARRASPGGGGKRE